MNNSLKYNTESKDRWSSIPLGNGKIGALVQANTKKHKKIKTKNEARYIKIAVSENVKIKKIKIFEI